MTCDQCRNQMKMVGREIKPGNSAIWIDGFVCSQRRCPGYATSDYEGRVARWPALTLMDPPVYSNIRGAMKFRDG